MAEKARAQTTTEYLFLIIGIIIFVILIYSLLQGNIIGKQRSQTEAGLKEFIKTGEYSLFFENFDSGTAERWTSPHGDWQVVNQQYEQEEIAAGEKTSYAGVSGWQNYYAEAKIQFKTIPVIEGTMGGISGRANKNTGARYSCLFDLTNPTGSEGVLRLYRFFSWDGTPDLLGSSSAFTIDNGVHTFAIRLNGNDVQCFFDDEDKVSFNDPTPWRNGLLSLEQNQATTAFDNIRAKYQSGPLPTGPLPTPFPSASPTPSPSPSPTPSPSPSPTPTPTAIVISNIAFNNVTDIAVNISWLTDVAASGSITYSTDPLLGGGGLAPLKIISFSDFLPKRLSFAGGGGATQIFTVSHTNEITHHDLKLTSLTASTDYYYQITSCNSLTCATSAIDSFTSGPPAVQLSAITIYSVTADYAVITWTTNLAANDTVEYGPTTGYGNASTSANYFQPNHLITLPSLTPGILYHYRVTGCSAAGACNTSEDLNFSTYACFDTDGGIVADVAGTVTNMNGTYVDSCANLHLLRENLCFGGLWNQTINFICDSCLDGACSGAYCGDGGSIVYNSSGAFADTCVGSVRWNYYCSGVNLLLDQTERPDICRSGTGWGG